MTARTAGVTLLPATAIVVGNMVGTGIFTSLGFQVADIQSGLPIGRVTSSTRSGRSGQGGLGFVVEIWSRDDLPAAGEWKDGWE